MATTQLGPNTVSTVGELPAVGSQAPGFDLVDSKFASLTDGDVAGKRVVLNIFPSIDTGVCQASVKKFNELAAGLDNTAVVNVSVDLPLAQGALHHSPHAHAVVDDQHLRHSHLSSTLVAPLCAMWPSSLSEAALRSRRSTRPSMVLVTPWTSSRPVP